MNAVSRLAAVFAMVLFALSPMVGAATANRLPAEAIEALRAATEVEIYSLEPWKTREPTAGVIGTLHNFDVLGKATLGPREARTAIAAFEAAVDGWDGLVAACFDPRHALRVQSNGQTYDFLLCYDCQSLAVYRDDERFASVGAGGSPQILNDLMAEAGLALSQTGYKPPSPEEVAKDEADMARWLAGMPASARPVWEASERFHSGLGLSDTEMAALRAALEVELPDRGMRIAALLRWLGSGEGPWSGFPGWESVPEELLYEYPTAAILAVAGQDTLDAAQREGAARLFSGPFFRKRPQDQGLLTEQLRRSLLEHALGTGDPDDDDRHQRARRAFEGS